MPLDLEILNNFPDSINLNHALDNRTEVPETPATYAWWCDIPFGRLVGESHVLYIGQTQKLGGPSETCRLYSYRFSPTERERRVRECVQSLTLMGRTIELRWCSTPPRDLDVETYERELLRIAEQDHLELPPFNRRV